MVAEADVAPRIALPSGIDPRAHRDAMAAIPAAVTVITSWSSDGQPVGATLSAVTSLSLEPALMLACFDRRSDTLKAIRASRRFMIHVLAHGQQDLAYAFSRKGPLKFDGVAWERGLLDLPQISGSAVTIACRTSKITAGGDHSIVIGEIVGLETDMQRDPIVYAQRKMISLEGARASA